MAVNYTELPKHENITDISGVVMALGDATKGLKADKEKLNAGELTVVLRIMKNAVLGLTDVVKKHSEDKDKVEKKTRETEDELDEYKQKNLKGKFVITSSKDKPTSMKKQSELSSEEPNALQKHIIALANEKYKVEIPHEDIASCHYLPSGGIFLSLWNLKPGSAFQKLTKEIKSKDQNRNVNIYFNFMLTKRRSALLFEVRKLKRTEKIARFYSDESGIISIKMKTTDENLKLSSFCQTRNSPVLTYTIPELLKLVADSQPAELHEEQ